MRGFPPNGAPNSALNGSRHSFSDPITIFSGGNCLTYIGTEGPAYQDHVWSYDFMQDRISEGRPIRLLTIIDEYTRECLSIDVDRSLASEDVPDRLTHLFANRGVPDHIRSDNGPVYVLSVHGTNRRLS